jgi:hypothetical protein
MQKLPSWLLFHDLLDQYWREFVMCIGFWLVDIPWVQMSVGWADICSMCLFHLSWWQAAYDLSVPVLSILSFTLTYFKPKLLNGLNTCSGHMLLNINWEIVFNESTGVSKLHIIMC